MRTMSSTIRACSTEPSDCSIKTPMIFRAATTKLLLTLRYIVLPWSALLPMASPMPMRTAAPCALRRGPRGWAPCSEIFPKDGITSGPPRPRSRLGNGFSAPSPTDKELKRMEYMTRRESARIRFRWKLREEEAVRARLRKTLLWEIRPNPALPNCSTAPNFAATSWTAQGSANVYKINGGEYKNIGQRRSFYLKDTPANAHHEFDYSGLLNQTVRLTYKN